MQDADHDDDGGGDGGEDDEAFEVVGVVTEGMALPGECEGEVDPGDAGAGEAGAESAGEGGKGDDQDEHGGGALGGEAVGGEQGESTGGCGGEERSSDAAPVGASDQIECGLDHDPRFFPDFRPINYIRGRGNGGVASRLRVEMSEAVPMP